MQPDTVPTVPFRPRHLLASFRLSVFLCLAQAIMVEAQFSYTVNNGAATITAYSGPGGAVVIPDTIAGYTVTALVMGKSGFGAFPTTSVSIPNTVTNIGPLTFAGCSLLTSITVPDGVVSLGNGVFGSCTSLGSVWLGSNVMTLGFDVFEDCRSLTDISASGANIYYSSADGILFNKSRTALVAFPPGKSGAYSVPAGVTSIADCAFESCTNLWSITIPDGVVTVGAKAFCECTAVTNLVLPGTLTSIGGSGFQGCSSLVSISLPNSVTSIGSRGFMGCVRLGSLALPDGLTSLDAYLFAGCSGLTNLTFGASLTNLAYAPFEYCSGLTRMTLPRTIRNIGYGAFAESGLISLIVPDTVTSVGGLAFDRSYSLKQILFQGHAPIPDSNAFYRSSPTIYYLPGTTNWTSIYAGRPALLWNAHIPAGASGFGVGTNGFSFNVEGDADLPLGIEASASLGAPAWSLLQSGTLTNGSLYFIDPDWTNHSSRFYRLSLP